MADRTVQAIIVQKALKYGLDPAAVLAVANVEGGIRRGAVGDKGTSFGPFQLHVGGALPRGKNAAWANSPEGIDYAISQMAQHAKGLHGKEAVASIVTNFERPANIPAEIQKAFGGYGQFVKAASQGGVAPVVAPTSHKIGGAVTPGAPAAPQSPQDVDWQSMFKQQAAQQILQSSLALAQGGDVGQYTQGLAGLAQMRAMDQAMAQQNQTPPATAGIAPPPPDGSKGVKATPASSKGFEAPAGGHIIGTPYQGTHTIGNWESDNAVDIAMPVGTPLRAMQDGVIGDQFGSLGSSGRFQGLRLHLKMAGNEAYYAHLSKYAPGIKPGVHVKKGQIIGYSGEASGVAHLHLGMESGNPLSLYK